MRFDHKPMLVVFDVQWYRLAQRTVHVKPKRDEQQTLPGCGSVMLGSQPTGKPAINLSEAILSTDKTVYLIDGTAYIHRAYHAIQSLSNSKGLPTNAIFGFTRILLKLMDGRSPQYGGIFFDAKGPTFRHEIYPEYKANRPAMPEDMAVQIPYIKKVTAAFRLPIFEVPGFEADDLIGTVAGRRRSMVMPWSS